MNKGVLFLKLPFSQNIYFIKYYLLL